MRTWTEAEWAKRRSEFFDHITGSKDILEFAKVQSSFESEPPARRRQLYCNILYAAVGLGADNSPPGRDIAYREILHPFEYEGGAREGMVTGACGGASSCAVLIRGVWQMLGAGDMNKITPGPLREDPEIRDKYTLEMAFWNVAQWAYNCDAFYGSYAKKFGVTPTFVGKKLFTDDAGNVENQIARWKAGDVVFCRNSTTGAQHIFTVYETAKKRDEPLTNSELWNVASLDGGSAVEGKPGDSTCKGIKTVNRDCRFNKKTGAINITFDSGGERTVVFWVDFEKVKFTDPEYFTAKRGPKHPGYVPKPRAP